MKVLFVILPMLNLLGVLLGRNSKKYIVVPLLLFAALALAYTGWRITNDSSKRLQEEKYWEAVKNKSHGGFDQWRELEFMRKEGQRANTIFLDLLFMQSFMIFAIQVFGRRRTNEGVYKWTVWIFGIVFVAMLCLRVMMSIVPSRIL